jgi:hypothetical protein
MAGVVGVIWGGGEEVYFCRRDWTGQITLKSLRKINFARTGWLPDGQNKGAVRMKSKIRRGRVISIKLNRTPFVPPKKLYSAPWTGRRRQSLRRLSPDLISKAAEDTAAQVTRIGLTFLGTAAFCLLSLLSPDTALLGGNEKINVPFAGPVSFLGFMLLGPTVLIALRVFLQIYVEHSNRLD